MYETNSFQKDSIFQHNTSPLHLVLTYCRLLCILWVYSMNIQNELGVIEMIHFLVECLDRHFGNVCELDILFHLDKVTSIVHLVCC